MDRLNLAFEGRKYMRREDILCSLQQLVGVEIAEATNDSCTIYDDVNGKVTQFNFNMTKELLASKIHISNSVISHIPMNKEKLAEYLFNNVDKNAFLTLDGLYFVYDKSDYEELGEVYNDCTPMEFYETKERGVMWFDHNVCIVGVKNIIERVMQTETHNEVFCIKRRIVGVTIHELRHLMMDTTLVLPEDEYPPILGHEYRVDDYAFEVTDNTVAKWMPIFD